MTEIRRRRRLTAGELADSVLAGDIRAAARLMRQADDDPVAARSALATLYAHTGRAQVVGVTGNPGSGKSTLVAELIGAYRRAGQRVGVVAVDPSSPFSGGALLGDRVRMMAHSADPGVFIRSVASRGALGGVSRSTEDIVSILDAFGCDVILVETVGVGQSEVEIVRLAQTTLVVLTPGYGDEVQALKAGLLEIADVFVINKADLQGADALLRQLRILWQLVPANERADWRPPILKTVARDGTGVAAVVEQIDQHRSFRTEHPTGAVRERDRMRRILLRLIEHDVLREVVATQLSGDEFEQTLNDLLARRRDPYTVAAQVLARYRSSK